MVTVLRYDSFISKQAGGNGAGGGLTSNQAGGNEVDDSFINNQAGGSEAYCWCAIAFLNPDAGHDGRRCQYREQFSHRLVWHLDCYLASTNNRGRPLPC